MAVNGRIAAVSVAYRNPGGGPVRFSALAGEDAFRAGRNAVRVFVVAGRPAHPTLDEATTSLVVLGGRLGALERDEQPAVRALEPARGIRGDQLALELLPAVRADDPVLLAHESQASRAQAGPGGSRRSSSSPTLTA